MSAYVFCYCHNFKREEYWLSLIELWQYQKMPADIWCLVFGFLPTCQQLMQWKEHQIHLNCHFFKIIQHWVDWGEFQFRCHFGEEECTGNKIHACSIKYISDQHKLADYIHCMIRYHGQLTQRAEQCSQTHQVPWDDIYNCSEVNRDNWVEFLD